MKLGILCLAVGLNLVVVGATVHYVQPRPSRPRAPAANLESVNASPEAPLSAGLNLPTKLDSATNVFRWQMLESDDCFTFTANLRSVGCPEQTVRDLILPRVEKFYAIKRATPADRPAFWSCGTKREAAQRACEARERALQQEEQTLLERLLGHDAAPSHHAHWNDLTEQAVIRFVLFRSMFSPTVRSAARPMASFCRRTRRRSTGYAGTPSSKFRDC